MDEIDSIGSSRIEFVSGGDSEDQRATLELLNQLDGFEAAKNIKVCARSKSVVFRFLNGFRSGDSRFFLSFLPVY